MSPRLTPEQRERAAGFAKAAGAIASSIAFASNMTHARDELRSAAFEGLSRAAVRYVPGQSEFSTYAWRCVTGAVLDAVRKQATRLSLEASLDAAEEITAGGDLATEAGIIAQVDAATALIMAGFAASCAASELHANGEAKLLEREAFAEVEHALADLPALDRRLFELRHRDGKEWKEVTQQVGMPDRTARDRCEAVRKRLQRALVRRGITPAR